MRKSAARDIKEVDIVSPALPGPPLSAKELKNLVLSAEKMPTISLQEAKAAWNIQKKKLKRLSH